MPKGYKPKHLIKHGLQAYQQGWCHCVKCLQAQKDFAAKRKEKRRPKPMDIRTALKGKTPETMTLEEHRRARG